MMYDDLEYIKDLRENGKYPKIHDNIFSLNKYVPVDNVLDLGCCHGLLSHRLGQVYKEVVGIEPNKRYCENLQYKENVHYYNFRLDKKNIRLFNKVLQKHNIQGIFCRRVLSEVYTTGGMELINLLKDRLMKNNINYIALEGRMEVSNATHPIKNTEKEIEFFEEDYEVIGEKGKAVVMKRKGV